MLPKGENSNAKDNKKLFLVLSVSQVIPVPEKKLQGSSSCLTQAKDVSGFRHFFRLHVRSLSIPGEYGEAAAHEATSCARM